MSVDTVQAAFSVQTVHPKQDAEGQTGREPRRDDRQKQAEREQQDPPSLFLNSLGQLTGKTINITA